MAKKKNNKLKTVTGTFIGTGREFGFVECPDMEGDIFIPAKYTNYAMHSDTVEVEFSPFVTDKSKSCEGKVVRIVERGIKRVVGTYDAGRGFGFCIPDNNKIGDDIFIEKSNSMGAASGHKVIVEIIKYPSGRMKAEGKVTEILGHINDPGVDVLSIVEAYEIPNTFRDKVFNQAERCPDEVSPEDIAYREDLRDVTMVTIDGEDAKDLDDAISVSRKGDGYELGVHIADVTNYVQEGSALDKEALKRGTSVYLADRVIPMLPHRLCNGICSLNAGENRLALSVIMDIDRDGNITSHRISETVINVNERMSYTAVAAILEDRDDALKERYASLIDFFYLAHEIAGKLRSKRGVRGSVNFDMPETVIDVDKDGKPIDIRPYEANIATGIIEDFMLAANETIASHFFWEEVPFLYRVHESPDPDKVRKLETLINNFGYHFKASAENIHPKEFQKLLDNVAGKPEDSLITRITLRSMKQARYSPVCSGHFGLACDYYCHFTSPIRRYPDLQIHRIIKDELHGRLDESKFNHYQILLPSVAEKSSKLERRAAEAEREVEKLKKVQYMSNRIGEEFEGIISGLTSYGIYVELPNTVEGMIRLSSLEGDFYEYDDKEYEVKGKHTGRNFKLGETLKIIVNSTDEFMRTIDFCLAPED